MTARSSTIRNSSSSMTVAVSSASVCKRQQARRRKECDEHVRLDECEMQIWVD